MTARVTFAEALAALTAALGEPTEHAYVSGVEHALWGDLATGPWVVLEEGAAGLDLCAGGAAAERVWLLAGAPPLAFPDAPHATLPDAVAAATRWLREGGAG